MDNEKLATELLHELKSSARRWFVAFVIMCAVELATIGGFLWYISLPVDEYEVSQEANENVNSRTTQIIDGDYNGETDD